MRIKVSMKDLGSAIAGYYQVAKDMGKEIAVLTFDVTMGKAIIYIRGTPPNKGVKLTMLTAPKGAAVDKATWIAAYIKMLEAKGYKTPEATNSANAAFDLGALGIKSRGIKGNAIVSINGSEMETTRKNALMMETKAGVTIINDKLRSKNQARVTMAVFDAAISPKFNTATKVIAE